MENIKELIKRIEVEINKTPSGELRNLLCDINIVIQALNIPYINNSVAFANWIGKKQTNGSWFRYHKTKLWFLYLHGHLTTEKLYDIYLKETTDL